MEFLKDSSNILNDCEFKFLPKFELEKIITKVRASTAGSDRNKCGIWNNFCTISSALDYENEDSDEYENNNKCHEEKSVRVLTENEVHSILQSNKIVAPLFGPPRRFNARSKDNEITSAKITENQALLMKKNEEVKLETIQNSQVLVSHQVEEVNVADIQQPKQSLHNDSEVQQQTTERSSKNDDESNDCDDDDDDDTITHEVEEFLRELEESEQKEKENDAMKIHSSETEKELICDANDKKFDFRNVDCNESGWQNDSPKTQNQLSNSIRQLKKQRTEKSNVRQLKGIPKEQVRVQNCVKATANANEKSLSTNKTSLTASAHFYLLMSKVVGYQERVCQYLDCLYEIICNPPQMIDGNDLSRRRQRSIEFANRFARNHLYQIGRTTEELRIMPDNPANVATKVETLFLYIMQATQSYLKSVEMFISTSCPNKLSALIEAILDASNVCYQRNIYSDQDKLFNEILCKCNEIISFLAINRNSKPVYVTYLNDYQLETESKKLKKAYSGFVSPYAVPFSLKKHKSPYQLPKNPFPIPKMKARSKNIKQTDTKQTVIQKQSETQFEPKNALKLKKSTSEISTMISRENNNDELIPKEEMNQLMEMIHNVTREKITEIVGSLFSQLTTQQEEINCSTPKNEPNNVNKINSDEDRLKSDKKDVKLMPQSSVLIDDQHSSDIPTIKYASATKIDDRTSEQEIEKLRKLRQKALAERLKIIQMQADNPLYVNLSIKEPWNLISEVSDKILEEMLENLINDLDFGDRSLIENFLKHELTY